MGFYGISPVLTETVSQVTSDPSVELGTRATWEGCDYIYVYNCNDSKPLYPSRCCYPRTGSSGYSVTVTNTASQIGAMAGVCVHNTISSGYYGWLMVRGLAPVSPDSDAVSFDAGDFLCVGVDDGFVSGTCTGLVQNRLVGFCVSSGVTITTTNAASALGKAYIKSDIW